MAITDKTQVKSITPKYPELMIPEAIGKWTLEFEKTKELERQLSVARQGLRLLEKEVEEQKKRLSALSEFFDIEYCTKEVKEIKNSIGMAVINPTDRRN